MASVFLGTVLNARYDMCLWMFLNKWDKICVWVSAWTESEERMNRDSCKKQICRLPGIHVTGDKYYEKKGDLQQQRQAACEHWLPKERKKERKDTMEMIDMAIRAKHFRNLSVDCLRVPH